MKNKKTRKIAVVHRIGLKKRMTVAEIITRSSIPTLQVSETITDKEREQLMRSGIKTLTIEDMVKRREKNIKAFRKMGKPGFYGSGIKAETK